MTPEERAQDIFDRVVRLGKYRDAGVAYDPIPFIADHIRQARAEALEEAVAYIKRFSHMSPSYLVSGIRALKQPADGEG